MNRTRWIAIAAAGLVLAAGITGAHALGLDDLPSVASVMTSGLPGDTLVYDRTGTVLLADVHGQGSVHTDVPLAAMGRWLPLATVAVDDPAFWSEPGVDPGRLVQAAWDGARGQSGGETGSSIVLRLIRLRLGVASHVEAVALAIRVSAQVPRPRILESYLNSLEYGNSAVGAEAAAVTYFQVDAGQLDLAQASLVAGLPAQPGSLDPMRHLAAARTRQRQVLDAMVRNRAITRQQADLAFSEPLHLVGPATLDVAPALIAQVSSELQKRLGKDALTRGYSVLSTLDWGLQQEAEHTLHDALSVASFRHATDAALVAVDPRSGEILALASRATVAPAYDYAVLPLSPGNLFRAFTYAAAIASRQYTMVTPVDDGPFSIAFDCCSYKVEDYDLKNHGPCALAVCMGNGLNIPAVRVEVALGVPQVVKTARALGAPPYETQISPNGSSFTSTTDAPPTSYGPSLTLGGYSETTLQMTTAMGTLADEGAMHQAEAMLRVSSPDGIVRFQARPGPGEAALEPGAAYIVSQTLADDSDRALVYGVRSPLALPGRHVAAESGTSEEFHDAWTAGYTPSLAAAVWVGTNGMSNGLTIGSDGIFVAAPAWHRFMQAALDQLGKGDEWYQPPADVQATTVDGRPAWFLPGTSAATQPPPVPSMVPQPAG